VLKYQKIILKRKNDIMEEEKEEKIAIRKKNWGKKLNILTFILTPVVLLALMIVTLDYTTKIWFYLKPKVIIWVLLLLEIIHIFLTALTGSSKRSTIIQSILLWLLELINKLRYVYTYEPITFSDFAYSTNAGEIFSIVRGSLLETIWKIVPTFSCLAVMLVFLIFIVHKFNFKFNKKPRIAFGIATLIILVILFAPSKWVKKFMLTYVYDRYSTNDYEHHSKNMHYYSEDSLLGGMYSELLESRIFEPENYDKDELKEILNSTSQNIGESDWEKANIIVTFSESFFDVSVLEDDVTFDVEPTSNFNSLKDKGIFINMISPSYGGVSANVEFEFLTGYSLNFFGKGYTPFMQLYKTNNYNSRPSLIKELNNNGYYTKVVFGKDYFKSEKVYERLGINEYQEKNIKSEYKGYYTSDEYLIDGAIEALENKSSDEKLFYMNCTIESHMPFVLEKYDEDEYDVHVTSNTLTKSQTEVIQSYAQSCYDADKQLRKIV
jgi:phosphoglycerol transferase MdoB-like AlkP superfamily enzyme